MKQLFPKLSNFLLDLFFPKKCLARLPSPSAQADGGQGCNKNGTYICDNCLNAIGDSGQQKCPEKSPLDRLIWAAPYSNPLIKQLIKLFKYHYIKELAKPLSQLIITQCGRSQLPHNAVIVPIPLHKQRLRERDFNQAELLAKQVAEYFSLPLENKVLIRKKYTPQQARIQKPEIRKELLKDAFDINPEFIKKCTDANENLLKDKTIILIDDVTTTGATLSEAAKILKRAGTQEIWGLVIAKG